MSANVGMIFLKRNNGFYDSHLINRHVNGCNYEYCYIFQKEKQNKIKQPLYSAKNLSLNIGLNTTYDTKNNYN